VNTVTWNEAADAARQLGDLTAAASQTGLLIVEFGDGGDGTALPWGLVERWVRARAVTVADVRGRVASPGLEVALCCDLVYLRPRAVARLALQGRAPSPGILWALGRRGPAAVARGLLGNPDLDAEHLLELGLAEAVVLDARDLPLPSGVSVPAMTVARDLIRASVGGRAGLGLELASFRLLFAAGEPEEGAQAFLQKRPPDFGG
jgi:enoyl-CoA hydratase/carnithine racemase